MNRTQNTQQQVAERLIAYLRGQLGDDRIDYRTPLTPIVGGYEVSTYRFRLRNAPRELSQDLVLRLFPEVHPPDEAVVESLVQNALAAQGYPTPSVFLTGTSKADLGGAFMIMEFMPGETMLVAAGQELPIMLGRSHAALHAIAPDALVDALREHGIAEERFRLGSRMGWLEAKSRQLPWLETSVRWLQQNRPAEPEQLVICHGDFHPLNILVEHGRVTAVLDWPNFMVGDPVLDVAFTVVLFAVAAKALLPLQHVETIIERYLEAYQGERDLDLDRLDYYRMLRCVMAFVNGAEGQAAWRSQAALHGLTEHAYAIAGIRVDVPDG